MRHAPMVIVRDSGREHRRHRLLLRLSCPYWQHRLNCRTTPVTHV